MENTKYGKGSYMVGKRKMENTGNTETWKIYIGSYMVGKKNVKYWEYRNMENIHR